MDQDGADTFIRYLADERETSIAIGRLSICGFGRAATNSVVLADTMASREHALIHRNATGHCTLNDLGSTNGTRLNGRQVTTPTELKSGDVIQIGRQKITFIQTAAPLALAETVDVGTQYSIEQQLVSVLVVDMRNYTRMSAAMGSERTGEMMGEIFREAGDLLKRMGCWSTKFIGDAIMALWTHPDDALTRADMVRTFDVISEYRRIFRTAEWKFRPPMPLRFGCGYNAGMASIGNLGSAGAADFTAMGEAVNNAFFLETATKQLGYDVLISHDVFDALSDVSLRPHLMEVDVRGEPLMALPLRFEDIEGFLRTLLAAR